MTTPTAPTRRTPPAFVPVTVLDTARIAPRLVRVRLGGADLDAYRGIDPAASVRLLLPEPEGLVLPEWNGNEFLLPDGRRPGIRTLTPSRPDPDGSLTVTVVDHGEGRLPAWVATAAPGSPAALSGPGRGYEIDPGATTFLLAGDESALPAIAQLLEAIPPRAVVRVLVELAPPGGAVTLPEHPGTTIRVLVADDDAVPGASLAAAIATTDVGADTWVWVAGEAAAVQKVRRDLLDGRGLYRAHCTIRGYWKHGRTGT
ncbi:MAG: siderophore-interacting protein [Acidimicrobiia bacterium]